MRFLLPAFHSAPGFLGALFLALAGCEREQDGPDWERHPPSARPTEAAEPAVGPAPAAVTRRNPPATPGASPDEVRFVVHNVRNWLEMERGTRGGSARKSPKPEKERTAVISLLLKQNPDILGLCEVGGESDVAEIQKRLEAAGHPMPHRHVTGGIDPTRRLALISRHPIASTKTRDRLDYRLNGRRHSMQRGILDATVDTPAGPMRFLGVHFKSKRETDEGDQELMRRNEAHLLRREIDGIFREDPLAPLVVYGDMNDTRQSPTLRAIHGPGNSPRSLLMIALKDSRGEYWTHHWSFQDVYSRIDYVLVSRAVRDQVAWDECRVIDDPEWSEGSDHRPLLIIFRN